MNATIVKIVNLLFEDLAETEEIKAIHDEILQNCQERYQDLREDGMSEDDAIHAVVESLSGMEDMLKEYPRKAADAEPADEASCCWSHDPAVSPVSEIRMEHMANARIRVVESSDELIHLDWTNPQVTVLVSLENKHLCVGLHNPNEEDISLSLRDGIDLDTLRALFRKLTQSFKNLDLPKVEITLAIPASLRPALTVSNRSGNIAVSSLAFEQLSLQSANGDLELTNATVALGAKLGTTNGDIRCRHLSAQSLHLSSTNGNLRAEECVVQENIRMKTTNGKIAAKSQCAAIDAGTVNGNVTLEGQYASIVFSTVNGDATAQIFTPTPQTIKGSTVGGNIAVYLPINTPAIAKCSTVSGKIHNDLSTSEQADLTIKLSTVSGNIKLAAS